MQELSLTYRIELAQTADAPVYLLVHGRAGTVDVMWTFRRSLPANATVISVQAPLADPSKGGFSWWLVEGEITREMIYQGVAALGKFIDQVLAAHGLEGKPLFALGFSQGAGALSVLLQQRPQLFKKVGLLAGFVIKEYQTQLESAEQKPQVLIAHGTIDEVVPLSRAEEGKEFLESVGVDVTFVTDPVGHKVGSQGMRAMKEFFL